MNYQNIMQNIAEGFHARGFIREGLDELAGRIDDELVMNFYRAMDEAGIEVTWDDEAKVRQWLADHRLDGRSRVDAHLQVLV